MRIKISLLILYLSFTLSSCFLLDIAEIFLRPQSTNKEKITREEAQRRLDLYWAITVNNVENVRQYLEEGYDPNKSMGEEGWADEKPLNIVSNTFYNTYHRTKREEEISEPPPDVAILQLLVEAGADVNERPYIWDRVYTWGNFYIESMIRSKNLSRTGRSSETKEEIEEFNKEKEEEPLYFIKDANRVLEAFLKAGADPDKRGHPYPYSLEAKRKRITDEEADRYFAKGTRPINEAIKKGMRWESQVDLLLQYTTLDEDSLKAAKESKDPAMIEKITRLWNEQNGR